MVDFSQIPNDWRVPGALTEIAVRRQNNSVFAWPARLLLVGPKNTSATLASNTPRQVFTAAEAVALAGGGSPLARMAAVALAANTGTPIWIATPAAPTGSAASGRFTFTGTATVAGTMAAYVDGVRIDLPVALGDTAAVVGARLIAAINAQDGCPTTAGPLVSDTSIVVLAPKSGVGTAGNDLDLRVNRAREEATPAGLACAITAMSGGTGTPSLTALISAIAADWYTDLAVAWRDSATLGALTAELDRRYTATGRLDMHAYVGLRGDYATATTFSASYNSPHLQIIPADASPSAPWLWAASWAARCAYERTQDPARQLRGITLPGILPPDGVALYIEDERDGLLHSGCSTWIVGRDGTVAIERAITSYTETSTGTADTAWLDAMATWVASRIRHDWRTYIALAYPRAKLVDDDSLAASAGASTVTCRKLKGEWAARCQMYERLGWIEQTARTSAAAVFTRNAADRNRVDVELPVLRVGNLMLLASSLQFEA